jgi:ketosteroid isomerase-like protein
MIKYIILFTALYCLNSYAQMDIQKGKDALRQADISFSDLSREKGVKEAFLAYIAGDGVLLRPFTMPIVGYEAVRKFLEEGDSNFQLTWVPLYADISVSGELGYTYGTYSLLFKDEAGVEQTRVGTYVSIWKLDSEGKWKFVLDTGNPGLEPKK